MFHVIFNISRIQFPLIRSTLLHNHFRACGMDVEWRLTKTKRCKRAILDIIDVKYQTSRTHAASCGRTSPSHALQQVLASETTSALQQSSSVILRGTFTTEGDRESKVIDRTRSRYSIHSVSDIFCDSSADILLRKRTVKRLPSWKTIVNLPEWNSSPAWSGRAHRIVK